MLAASDVFFSRQLIVLQLDKESPRYTYEEPAFHMTENAIADTVSIHPTMPADFLHMLRQFFLVKLWTFVQISGENISYTHARGASA